MNSQKKFNFYKNIHFSMDGIIGKLKPSAIILKDSNGN